MTEKEECDHEFEYPSGYSKEIRVKDETIEIPVKCKRCEIEAWEVWIYSCVMSDDGEMLQT